MIFVSESQIYNDETLARKFSAQDTQFNVIQGKISALITDAELEELRDGSSTMYSKLSSVEQDVSGITLTVQSLSQNLAQNYSTTIQMTSAISQTAASINQSIAAVNTRLTNDYSTTQAMTSAIEESANAIFLSVSDTLTDYSTTDEVSRLISDKRTTLSIGSGEVNLSTSVYNSSTGQWTRSEVDIADAIRIQTTGALVWNAANSSMTEDGFLTCTGGKFTNATGDFTIGDINAAIQGHYNDSDISIKTSGRRSVIRGDVVYSNKLIREAGQIYFEYGGIYSGRYLGGMALETDVIRFSAYHTAVERKNGQGISQGIRVCPEAVTFLIPTALSGNTPGGWKRVMFWNGFLVSSSDL